ncbi:MAG: ComEC/Rec2 family competence protein [Candidatus Paceibacterota bacterium]
MKISYKQASLTREKSTLFFLVLFFTLTTFVSWSVLFFTRSEKQILSVVMLDVGQGDAFFIESPGGTQVLIDGGRGRAALRELSKVMPFWDRSLDVVVATHPDADHIGGLVHVLERFDVSYILHTSIQKDTPVFRAYSEAVLEEDPVIVPSSRGTKITLDDSVVLTILSREVVAASDTNEASIILRLDYGGTSFLFTGDAPKETEQELLQFYSVLDVDVLKVGHHGSDTSTSTEFISATSPDFALISVGKENSYGHPDDDVLLRLEDAGVKILRSDERGTVRLISDGEGVFVKPLHFFEELLGL